MLCPQCTGLVEIESVVEGWNQTVFLYRCQNCFGIFTTNQVEYHNVENHVDNLNHKEILSENQILERKYTFQKSPGIYFLIDGDEIVYIGKSDHVPARLKNHVYPRRRGSMKKDFNKVAFVRYPESKLDEPEMMYIKEFQPKHNGSYKWRL